MWIKGIQWSTKKKESQAYKKHSVLDAAAVIVTVRESSNPLAGHIKHPWPGPCTLSSFASHDLVPTSQLRSQAVSSSRGKTKTGWSHHTFTHRALPDWCAVGLWRLPLWVSHSPLCASYVPQGTLHRSFITLLGLCILFPPQVLRTESLWIPVCISSASHFSRL